MVEGSIPPDPVLPGITFQTGRIFRPIAGARTGVEAAKDRQLLPTPVSSAPLTKP